MGLRMMFLAKKYYGYQNRLVIFETWELIAAINSRANQVYVTRCLRTSSKIPMKICPQIASVAKLLSEIVTPCEHLHGKRNLFFSIQMRKRVNDDFNN